LWCIRRSTAVCACPLVSARDRGLPSCGAMDVPWPRRPTDAL
jgi:hypothetical protein